MNHFKISLIKSILRVVCCLVAIVLSICNYIIPAVCALGGGLALAEVLGVLEEVYDKRKE